MLGVLAVGPVAVVALDEDDRLHRLGQLLRRNVGEMAGEAGVRSGVVVGHPHAAADDDVEALQFVAAEISDDSDVLSVDIDAVIAQIGDAGLELAGQVIAAVDGLLIRLGGDCLLAIEPDLVVGAGLRQQAVADELGVLLNLDALAVFGGGRAAHYVALQVSAGSQGGDQRLVHGADGGLQPAFQHPMELEVLPRGHPQRVVGVARGQLVADQVLIGAQDAARDFEADHEDPSLVLAFPLQLLAEVAVVLLVDAVELKDLIVLFGEVRGIASQLFGNTTSKVVTVALDELDLGLGLLAGRRCASATVAHSSSPPRSIRRADFRNRLWTNLINILDNSL